MRHEKTDKHTNLIRTVSQTQSLDHLVNQLHFLKVGFAELKLAAAIAE